MSTVRRSSNSEAEFIHLGMRVPKSLRRRIHLDAIAHGVSMSAWITEALVAHLTRSTRAQAHKAPATGTR